MPIYEYVCNNCGKRLSFLVMKIDEFSPQCNKCESKDLRRIMSRFRSVESEETRMERMTDPGRWGDLDENDPKSMVRLVKKMGKELGDELGEDYDQIIQEAEEEAEKMGSAGNFDNSDDELL